MPITINDCRNCNKPPMILKVEEHLNEEFEIACGGCGQETETFDEQAIKEWNAHNPRQKVRWTRDDTIAVAKIVGMGLLAGLVMLFIVVAVTEYLCR